MEQGLLTPGSLSSGVRTSAADRAQAWLPAIVADAFDVCTRDLTGSTRGCAKVALARQAGMYLARVSLGLTLSEASGLFGRERTTAAHACRVIEDLRDNPAFDAHLGSIELLLAAAARVSPQ